MALTEDLTFKLGNSGVILNTDSVLSFVDIDRVTGLDSAPYRITERDHEGTDGGFIDAEFEKGRTVLLEGTVYGSTGTIESYLDSLKANYAPSTSLQPFYFKVPGVNERVLFVKPLGCRYDWETARRLGTTQIQFSVYAEDPRIYDSTLIQATITQGAQTFPGFGFDFGFDFGFGGTTSTSDGTTVTNSSNRPSPPTFSMTGPVTNPEILSDTAGTSLKFIIGLAGSDTLTVDTYYRTVKLNGTANRRGTLQFPNWFNILPGENFIRYRAESAGSSVLTVSFRSAWR